MLTLKLKHIYAAKHYQVCRHTENVLQTPVIWNDLGLNIIFFVKNVIAKLFISGSLVVNSTLRPLVFQQIVKASDMVNGTGRYRKDCKCRLLLDILNFLERFQIQCVQ